jgi:hypothetical protein
MTLRGKRGRQNGLGGNYSRSAGKQGEQVTS